MSKLDYANANEVFNALQIPEIQSLEVALRAEAAKKRSDLRLLVGESYRDLLTTADTIVSMKESTVMLRSQLGSFISACDSKPITKKLKNLQAFPQHYDNAREKVLLRYLAELRSVVVHFLRQDDLIMAARLYAVGRLISRTQLKHKMDLTKRIQDVRGIVMKAINKCTNIEVFSTAFAILESATPATCLKYFLSLQIHNLSHSSTLHELVSACLHIIESTRQFSHLGEVFEDISRRPLIAAIRTRVEIDVNALESCLDEDGRQYRPYLRVENLPASEVRQQVNEWLVASAIELCRISSVILDNETNIQAVIKLGKDVRNMLDEAARLDIYTAIEPAIDARLIALLESSITALSEVRAHVMRVLDRQEIPESLWSSRIPWSRGTLANFKHITRKTMKGDSNASNTFERTYTPILEAVKKNLEVLAGAKSQAKQRLEYIEQIARCYRELCQTLMEEARVTDEKLRLISIMRMMLYLRRTIPVPDIELPQTSSFFSKLVQKPVYKSHDDDLSKTFDKDTPITISPSTARFLMEISSNTAELGIDILGIHERALVRELISEALISQRGLERQSNDDEHSPLSENGQSGDLTLPQNRPATVHEDVTQQSPTTEMLSPPLTNGINHTPATTANGSSHKDSTQAVAKQNYFDHLCIQRLFSVAQAMRPRPASELDADATKAIDLAASQAVHKFKVLYGTLL